MAERRQKLRGTTAQLDTLNGPQGLLAVDLTRLELRLYDGTSAAGSRIPNLATITANFLGLATGGTVTGRLASSTSIASHSAVGGASLDVLPATGQGRISFNHEQGAPVVDRNSGAIAFNMDDDTNPAFEFSLVGANRVATPVPLQRALTLNRTNITLNPDGGAGAPTVHLKAPTGTTNSYLLMGDSGSITDDFVLRHYTGPTDQQEVLFSVKGVTLFSMASTPAVRTRVTANFDQAINVSGSAGINGPLSTNSTLTAAGLATLNGGLTVGAGDPTNLGGATTISSTLGVVGAANFSSTLTVAGNASIGGAFGVTGTSIFQGLVTLNGSLTTGGAPSSFGGPVTVGSNLTVNGGTTLNTLNVTGAATTQNSALPSVKSVVNREAGDARYVMKSGAQSMAGPLSIIGVAAGGNAINLGVDTRINWSNDYITWLTGVGLLGYENGVESWRLESGGTSAPEATTVMTRSKGDARYIQKTDSAIPTSVMNAIKAELVDFFVPVGTVLVTHNNVNPGTRFAGTTWVAHAPGRAIVGVGTADGVTYTSGFERGRARHTLTLPEMPVHNHEGNTSLNGEHNHIVTNDVFQFGVVTDGALLSSPGANLGVLDKPTTEAGLHNHILNIASTGGGESHNNIQPSIGAYIWRRTA